jgi:hypothetical protein
MSGNLYQRLGLGQLPQQTNQPSGQRTIPGQFAARHTTIIQAPTMPNQDWSEQEITLIITDYLDMLTAELRGAPYNKAEHRRMLLPLLDGRSSPSVEFKHRNISYLLQRMGLPYIDGYKPADNAQKLLATILQTALTSTPTLHAQIVQQLAHTPEVIPDLTTPFNSILVPPPHHGGSPNALPPPEITPVHIDFAEREAANRKLGRLGEEWALAREKQRLSELGRPDLVKHVEWVSDLHGDGLGFDILSRDTDDTDLFIEVKTTNLAAQFPFFLTSNELNTSLRTAERYRLYRIFHFNHAPRMFILSGALDQACTLRPSRYIATVTP